MSLRKIAFVVTALFLVGALVYLRYAVEPGQPNGQAGPAEGTVESVENSTRQATSTRAPKPDVAPAATTRPRQVPGDPGPAKPQSDPDRDREIARVLEQIEEVNLLYDRSDYAGVVAKGKAALEARPNTVRILRVLVPSSCILGDAETARTYYAQLRTEPDRRYVQEICGRYDIQF